MAQDNAPPVQFASRNHRLRLHCNLRYNSMEQERTSFLQHWQDIADHIRPRSVRINKTIDQNKGGKFNQKILNETGTLASRTLRGGLMAGLTSPARPWFKLTSSNPAMSEYGKAKDWLYDVEEQMRELFAKSNLYQILPLIYGDLADYGTSAMIELEDAKAHLRFYHFTVGEYMIAVDKNNRCNALYRRFPMTVARVVDEYGYNNCTEQIRSMFNSKQYEQEVEICHVIEPNNFDRNPESLSSDNKPFRSVHYEWNSSYDKVLRRSGYDEFPVMAPRWDLFDDSVYGYSPGMDALPTLRQLMLKEKRLQEAIDKWVRPPMIGDSSMRTQRSSILPGDVTYIDGLASQRYPGFRPAYTVNPDIEHISADIEKKENIVKRCYYEDMMMMLAEGDNPEMTAREVEERHQEKVMAIGPVLERLNDELFDPLIERTFGLMWRLGLIPDPPDVLMGQDLKVEYISILAQAQKLLGTANIEKVAAFATGMAQAIPDILDRFNADEALETYADLHGINPNIIRTDDEVTPLREARAKQQQMQQMAAMAGPAKEAAMAGKAMGDTKGENVQDIFRQMTGQ